MSAADIANVVKTGESLFMVLVVGVGFLAGVSLGRAFSFWKW